MWENEDFHLVNKIFKFCTEFYHDFALSFTWGFTHVFHILNKNSIRINHRYAP